MMPLSNAEIMTLLAERTDPIEEHVERLRKNWQYNHEQIRHHLYRAVESDVRYASTQESPEDREFEGHAAALLAVEIAGGILNAVEPTAPGKLPREKLLVLIENLRSLVEADDSMEGYINYSWSETPGIYDVSAVLRTGNSMGQGGMLVVNSGTFPPPDSKTIPDGLREKLPRNLLSGGSRP